MSDDIREILEDLKDEDKYCEDYGYQYKRISLKDTKLLLDYITNLQQENERLKLNHKQLKDIEKMAISNSKLIQENERLKDWKEDLLKENIELENIRKEAIEYIKNTDFDSGDNIVAKKVGDSIIGGFILENKIPNDLLNILQGKDNDSIQ